MRLDEADCRARLHASDHGVLATVHETRGVDAVPVVFAIVGREIVVPVDTVKPKQHTRLQRLLNVERDPRCVLLVDEYGDDWSQLWWVRVHGRAVVVDPTDEIVAALAARYPPYAQPGAVTSALLLVPDVVTGWAAS